MPRLRVEIAHLKDIAPQHFGVLQLKPLFQKKNMRQISVFHISLKAGSSVPALYHRKTHEFFFVLKGNVTGRIGNKTYRFRAGDYCFLPAGSIHGFHVGKSAAQTLEVFFPRLDLRKPDIVLA